MKSRPILIVEDGTSLGALYGTTLRRSGYDVIVASTLAAARLRLREAIHDVVLLDIHLPDGEGLGLIAEVIGHNPDAKAVVISAHSSVPCAVEAMRAGAFDFLIKPLDDQTLLNAVMNARAESGQAARRSTEPLGGLIGSSEMMRQVYKRVRTIAGSAATVFLTGEAGTGKQLCARAIHALSQRSDGPFVMLNCAAMTHDELEHEIVDRSDVSGLPPRALERADGGTLFLQEVCELSPRLQTALLHLLGCTGDAPEAGDTRHYNTRVICATSRDPLVEMKAGRLHRDLYYRLNVLPLHLPPLRDRGTDVIEIAEALLARLARSEKRPVPSLSPEVRALFIGHRWPGNVRQLKSLLWNQVVLNGGGTITLAALPAEILDGGDATGLPAISLDCAVGRLVGLTLAEVERHLIEATIAAQGGAITAAARQLGVSPSTLYRKLDAWGRNPTESQT